MSVKLNDLKNVFLRNIFLLNYYLGLHCVFSRDHFRAPELAAAEKTEW